MSSFAFSLLTLWICWHGLLCQYHSFYQFNISVWPMFVLSFVFAHIFQNICICIYIRPLLSIKLYFVSSFTLLVFRCVLVVCLVIAPQQSILKCFCVHFYPLCIVFHSQAQSQALWNNMKFFICSCKICSAFFMKVHILFWLPCLPLLSSNAKLHSLLKGINELVTLFNNFQKKR